MIRKKSIATSVVLTGLITLMVLALIFTGGCSQPQPAAPAPADPAAPAPAAPAEPEKTYDPVELNLCNFMAPMHPLNAQLLGPWADEVAEKTDGRVKIFIYPSNELVGANDNYDATVQGVIDIGLVLPAYTPGRFPLTHILEFPFMFESPLQANLTAWEVFNTTDAIRDGEYKDVEVLWWGTTDLGHFLTVDPKSSKADLQGNRLRSPSIIGNDVINALGAVPVTLPVPEVYDAIDRGIVDGTLLPISTLNSFNLGEVVNYVLEMNMYATPLHMVMNRDSWNKISPSDQAIIKETLSTFPETIGNMYTGDTERGYARAEADGITVTTPTAEALAEFHQYMDPLIDGWLDDMEADGLPAREVYELVRSVSEKYK